MATYSNLLHGDYIGTMNSKKEVSLTLYSWPALVENSNEKNFGYAFQVSIGTDVTNHNALVCTFNMLGYVMANKNYQDLDAWTRVNSFDNRQAKDLLSFRVRYMRISD